MCVDSCHKNHMILYIEYTIFWPIKVYLQNVKKYHSSSNNVVKIVSYGNFFHSISCCKVSSKASKSMIMPRTHAHSSLNIFFRWKSTETMWWNVLYSKFTKLCTNIWRHNHATLANNGQTYESIDV